MVNKIEDLILADAIDMTILVMIVGSSHQYAIARPLEATERTRSWQSSGFGPSSGVIQVNFWLNILQNILPRP